MTLNQLEYFCAVARHQSITRAAEALFVTQPTVSIAVRELEKEFHMRLFMHEKNRISLTQEGQEFYKYAEAMLRSRHEMISRFSDADRKPLRIGIPPLISTVFFPRLTDRFTEEMGIPVQLFEYGSKRARTLIDNETLDVAVGNLGFYDIGQFHSLEMLRDHYVYCVARTHRFAKKDRISFEMLEDEPIVLFNTDSVQNDVVLGRFAACGIKPKVLLHSSQLGTILNFVRGGTCGAFLFSCLPVHPRDFIEIPISPAINDRFGLIWKKGVFLPDRSLRFINFIKEQVDQRQNG